MELKNCNDLLFHLIYFHIFISKKKKARKEKQNKRRKFRTYRSINKIFSDECLVFYFSSHFLFFSIFISFKNNLRGYRLMQEQNYMCFYKQFKITKIYIM